jgi:murein DD-endopeptidase MepM/ murein hydrolase activator NlpD
MKKLRTHPVLRRVLRTAVALVFLAALAVPQCAPAARAVTQADIDALKGDASDLKSQKKALQSKLDAISGDISDTMKKKENLDGQISNLSAQISNAEKQIATYASLISQTEAELKDAQQREQAQYDLFCRRVRAMEEQGDVSYWSVLFKATSFPDLLSRLDAVNEIMDSDQRVIDDLQALQEEISAKQTSLEQDKADSEAVKSDLVSKKNELDQQRSAANALVAKLNASKGSYEDTMDDLSAEEEKVQNRIVALSRQLAAEIEAARKKAEAAGKKDNASGAAVSASGYIWPVSSHKVNSGFGYRSASSTNGVGSTYHKGIDIGGVGYNTTVHAAKAGEVIVSQYSSSYGNYVVIAHGSGNTTLYGHMSSRSVSVGQYVSQGDAIGVTGSTGHSTGPHLHFEISINGERVNPLNYLP